MLQPLAIPIALPLVRSLPGPEGESEVPSDAYLAPDGTAYTAPDGQFYTAP